MELGNGNSGKLLRSFVDGAKTGEADGECCEPRVLSVKSSLCIYKSHPGKWKE